MNWIALKSPDQLETLRAESKNQPVIIFKHSTTCSISKTALNRLERNWKEEEMSSVKSYYLDLLSYREISHSIADLFDVEHQSPQVIVLKNGEAVFHKSHFDIEFTSIKNAAVTTAPVKN
jgi:bacillithiol system protein YtxJ